MHITILGAGAREHALAYTVRKSENARKITCIPGNAGLERDGFVCMDVASTHLLQTLVQLKPDLVFIGPEALLETDLATQLQQNSILCFAPSKMAAQLETSKVFAKQFMQRHHIPTADYQVCDDLTRALQTIQTQSFPFVIKADGLAFGKGTFIVHDKKEAESIIVALMQKHVLGDAGRKIIIEHYLPGSELSFFILLHGDTYTILGNASDYKKRFEKHTGPNTGGMGAVFPSPFLNKPIETKIIDTIVNPTISGLKKENIFYSGFLYFGIIIHQGTPFLLEYNARLGDPEAQVLLPNLKTDLVQHIQALIKCRSTGFDLEGLDSRLRGNDDEELFRNESVGEDNNEGLFKNDAAGEDDNEGMFRNDATGEDDNESMFRNDATGEDKDFKNEGMTVSNEEAAVFNTEYEVLFEKPFGMALTLVEKGYPETKPETSFEIDIPTFQNIVVFHYQTALQNHHVVSIGGRVLSLVGFSNDKDDLRRAVYSAAKEIEFKNKDYRGDVG